MEPGGTPYWAAMRSALSRWPLTRPVMAELVVESVRGQEVAGDAAQADDGVADFARGGLGVEGGCEARGQAERAQAGKVSSSERRGSERRGSERRRVEGHGDGCFLSWFGSRIRRRGDRRGSRTRALSPFDAGVTLRSGPRSRPQSERRGPGRGRRPARADIAQICCHTRILSSAAGLRPV